MTIGMAESLLETNGFDGHHLAHTFARHYAAEPWRGYGASPPEVFGKLERGVPWQEASATLFSGSGSFGNGAAMRVAPVALFAHPDTHTVASLARQTAIVTHTHPEGTDGAVSQAVAVDRLLARTRMNPSTGPASFRRSNLFSPPPSSGTSSPTSPPRLGGVSRAISPRFWAPVSLPTAPSPRHWPVFSPAPSRSPTPSRPPSHWAGTPTPSPP